MLTKSNFHLQFLFQIHKQWTRGKPYIFYQHREDKGGAQSEGNSDVGLTQFCGLQECLRVTPQMLEFQLRCSYPQRAGC